MCGIAGYIGKKTIQQPIIERTLQLMSNRGPDDQTYKSYQLNNTNIYFLHSRLSIIDLAERSNQPYEIGDYVLTYNGEIYNYIEVRNELRKKGHNFVTASDTEVLLKAYIEYGQDCVKHFNGMWSFAILDKKKNQVFLSRDRFAEKPLYYLQNEDGLYFGSEIKFIQSLVKRKLKVNYQHIARYLVNGYKSLYKTSETFFEEIKELKYATNATIDVALNFDTYRYWQPTFTPQKMTLQEAIEGARHHLLESVKIRLRSDVPLAFCLSGGVDSSGLAAIARKCFNYDVATFSIIDSDERYNEYDNIKASIDDLQCKHTLINISYENTFEKLKALVAYHDVPIATISYFVHSLLSEAISQNGYKVAISGTSADELFTGYYDHFNLHLYEMRNHPDYQKYVKDWYDNTGKFVRNPYLKNPALYIENPDCRNHVYLNNHIFASYLKQDFSETFTETKYCDSLLRSRMLNELFHEATPLILHEDDLNSMKYSIENRSPYLDPNLFSFAYSIPAEHLILDGYGKYVLREALGGILNDQVRLDRRKKGFNAAITSIVDFKDKETREYLLDKNSTVFDIIKPTVIEEIFAKETLPNSYSKFLFNFINTKMFLDQQAELDF